MALIKTIEKHEKTKLIVQNRKYLIESLIVLNDR